MGKRPQWGTFPKAGVGLGGRPHNLALGP